LSQLGQIAYVDINKIHANNYNPNVMDEEKFNALVDFCKTNGAEKLDPIWIRNDGVGKYEVIDGEHRLRAAKEVGWVRLRAFIVDMEVDVAKAFNVRKNRERGRIDVFKLGRIFLAERKKPLQVKEIAKKYGYFTKNGSSSMISEIQHCAEYEDQIRERLNVDTSTRVSMIKAITVLRELKREERGEQPKETKEIVDEMVNEVAPALEKAFGKVKPYDKHNPERNKLVLNMLLKNLTEGLLFCPVCKEKMLECSHCHTSLAKMKEAKQL